MKLAIKLDWAKYLIIPAESAGIVVPALSASKVYTEDYKTHKFTPVEDNSKLEFSYVEDSVIEESPEAFVALQKSRDESETKYLTEWTKGQELRKEIETLKAQLEKVKTVTS